MKGAEVGFNHMTPEQRQQAARNGGLKVSKDRQHMSVIGRKGGGKLAQDRQYMADIGRKGGNAKNRKVVDPPHDN